MNKKHLSDPLHPIWSFARFALPILALTVILWINASDFDMTEGKSIAMLAAVLGGGWGVEKLLQRNDKSES